MSPELKSLFDECLNLTGSPEAAATLVLAQVQSNSRSASRAGALLNLKDAAAYLGYESAGLRKLVKQKRIQFIQNGRGPIRFRREWLDEFIESEASAPRDAKRPAEPRRPKSAVAESRFGLDPKLLRRGGRRGTA